MDQRLTTATQSEPGEPRRRPLAALDSELRETIRSFWRHKWAILGVVVLLTGLAVLYVQTATPRYTAELQVVFDRDRLAALGLDMGVMSETLRQRVQGVVPTRFKEADRQIDIPGAGIARNDMTSVAAATTKEFDNARNGTDGVEGRRARKTRLDGSTGA